MAEKKVDFIAVLDELQKLKLDIKNIVHSNEVNNNKIKDYNFQYDKLRAEQRIRELGKAEVESMRQLSNDIDKAVIEIGKNTAQLTEAMKKESELEDLVESNIQQVLIDVSTKKKNEDFKLLKWFDLLPDKFGKIFGEYEKLLDGIKTADEQYTEVLQYLNFKKTDKNIVEIYNAVETKINPTTTTDKALNYKRKLEEMQRYIPQ